MGASRGSYPINFAYPHLHNQIAPTTSSVATDSSSSSSDCDHSNELKIKSLLYKMIWEFGLGCILPQSRSKNQREEREKKSSSNSEHNKAWLLAESGPDLTSADPQSVHSSFRFLFFSLG